MTVIDKATASGQRIEIKIEGSFASLYLDGSLVEGGSSAPLPLAKPRGEITHWMGRQGQAVGLTTAEADQVRHALIQPARRVRRPDPATTWSGDASMDRDDSIF